MRAHPSTVRVDCTACDGFEVPVAYRLALDPASPLGTRVVVDQLAGEAFDAAVAGHRGRCPGVPA